jgi:hypothetical protein
MPHPRLRSRLHTLVIAVAIVGLTLGGWTMWRRREYCLRWVRAYVSRERALRSVPRTRAGDLVRYDLGAGQFYLAEEAADDERLAERYRQVARYPWLPLPRKAE